MTRRMTFAALTAVTAGVAVAQQNPSGDWIMEVLRGALQTKKGVTLHVKGQTIAIVVTAIGDHFVEGRNQQFTRMVVRLESIDAAAVA